MGQEPRDRRPETGRSWSSASGPMRTEPSQENPPVQSEHLVVVVGVERTTEARREGAGSELRVPKYHRRTRSRVTESTHWRTGRSGNTSSVRCAATSALRRALHEGQTPRTLRERMVQGHHGGTAGAINGTGGAIRLRGRGARRAAGGIGKESVWGMRRHSPSHRGSVGWAMAGTARRCHFTEWDRSRSPDGRARS